MRKMVLFGILVLALAGCGDSDVTPDADGGPGGDADVMDAGDIDVEEDVEVGVDTDGGEDADADMGGSDGGDVDSGDPDADGGGDADGGSNCQEGVDTDADGLDDCDEAQLCTSKTNSDTDGDGLSDLEELNGGTRPCKADSDEDGVNDRRESNLGLDPNDPSTFDDGTVDGDRWRVDACATSDSYGPEDEVLSYYTNDRGNWRVGLPDSLSNYQGLQLQNSVTAPAAMAVYGDPLTSVYGFILSKSAPSGQPSAYHTLENVVRPRILSLLTDKEQIQTGTNFETHGGHQGAIGRYMIKVSPKRSAQKLREQLLFGLAEPTFDRSQVLDPLPSTAGSDESWFRVAISVVYRTNTTGRDQALYSVAVTPKDVYESRAQVRFQIDDLVNTTNIAEVPDEPLDGCETFTPDADIPKAEFYWVLDQSSSMDSFSTTVSNFATDFVEQLRRVQLDYRLGVTNMVEGNDGRLRSPGWTKDPARFSNAVTTGVTDCQPMGAYQCSGLDEYGLKNAKLGLRRMLGLSGRPSSTRAIRTGAEVITIFMTDDSSNSIRDGTAAASDYVNFLPDHTQVFSIVDKGGCGARSAPVYEQISADSQGRSASICLGIENLSGILSSIIQSANARASDYKLSKTPISSSLQVYLNGNFVPRSKEHGFNYFAEYNSISFYGSYAPEPSEPDSNIAEDFVAVEYDYFQNHCKEADRGANNCSEDF